MKDKTYHAYLDSHERQLVIHSLVELKNRLIQEGRYTDCVDELIFKVVNAPGMSANPTITGNLLIHTFHCRLKSHSWKRFWDYDTFVV